MPASPASWSMPRNSGPFGRGRRRRAARCGPTGASRSRARTRPGRAVLLDLAGSAQHRHGGRADQHAGIEQPAHGRRDVLECPDVGRGDEQHDEVGRRSTDRRGADRRTRRPRASRGDARTVRRRFGCRSRSHRQPAPPRRARGADPASGPGYRVSRRPAEKRVRDHDDVIARPDAAVRLDGAGLVEYPSHPAPAGRRTSPARRLTGCTLRAICSPSRRKTTSSTPFAVLAEPLRTG